LIFFHLFISPKCEAAGEGFSENISPILNLQPAYEAVQAGFDSLRTDFQDLLIWLDPGIDFPHSSKSQIIQHFCRSHRAGATD
jgi:hypothetical protein